MSITSYILGGSIGSALAILTFYPLERIRVEIQSQQQQQQKKKNQPSRNNQKGCSKEKVIENPSSASNHPPPEKYNRHPPNQRSKKETILQCLIRLHKEKSLYRGAANMAITLSISNFVFFYALQVTRKSLASFHKHNHYNSSSSSHQQRHQQQQQQRLLRLSKSLSSLLASTLAGVINVLLTNPLWVASLRIIDDSSSKKKCIRQTTMSSSSSTSENSKNNANNNEGNNIHHHHYQTRNLWNVIHQIATEEGPLQLWNGTLTSLLLVSNPIIQHFLYEQMRLRLLMFHHHHHHRRGMKVNVSSSVSSSSSLTPAEAFVLGALSKMVATIVTYPLQLAQVLLRLQSSTTNDTNDFDRDFNNDENNDQLSPPPPPSNNNNNAKAYKGMIDCLHQQFLKDGIPGLFQGMNAKLLSTVLTAAFTFLSYEQTLLLVGKLYREVRLLKSV